MSRHEPTAEIHGFSDPGAEPTPWADGVEVLKRAETYWISTVRPDGRPHVTPLIALWHDDAIWFATGDYERKYKNLAKNPRCIFTTGDSHLAGLDVVLEGEVERVTDEEVLKPVASGFAGKYGTDTWDYSVRDGGFHFRQADVQASVHRVVPTRALGFRKGDEFSQTTWEW